ncbi:serine/threonine-protein kinase [Cellulomonas fimi]|uniref:non-specific serine/threonine protein kinase n=1 Tax=Cellulomonas fimi TaxID=1708 RepID=A0A7Y0LYX0_CELFI|nr:serine/threonine-protein kinase [Cellulomonas fimi]NMR20450.1 protein kinase [Cellulomonas fimi]
MKPTPGTALVGRYRLERQIAVGGMGEVWAAHDLALARDVAVKVLREEFAGDKGFLDRFRTEARNAGSLSHPNIAQLYDYGEQDGSAYLVMELVVGEPMSDLLEREPVLPIQRLLPILAQTARALHAAHVAGVVHRDVKPGNILLGRGGRVKITDFGVSLAVNQVPMTATGMVMGTAQYLSPEQAIGRPATPSSDLYSLGIVAYESLVGHRPFTGPTAVDIAVAHVNKPVPPLPPSIEPRLAELVMRMLSKEPAERPRSATALARTFDQMVESTPPEGVPVMVSAPAGAAVAPTTVAPPAGAPPTVAPGGIAAPPPSYPPRRQLRETRESAGGRPPAEPRPSSRAATRTTTTRTTTTRTSTTRTSTTTGWRLGRVTWPMLALILLLIALLGGALADTLVNAAGPDEGAGARPAATAPRSSTHVTGSTAEQAADGEMIIPSASGELPAGAPTTTTAKDA